MRIALTGGSGFIGRRFARAAMGKGHRIRHLVRDPAAIGSADDVRVFDLAAPIIDAAILADCDAVVHLAAHIPRDHDDPAEAERCWRINALGTRMLVDAAIRAGVGRFVHSSSANAYAAWETNPDERAAQFPRSRGQYLGSKLLQEIYADQTCRSAGLPLATVRLSSVYGPGQARGAVAVLAAAIIRGAPVRLDDGGRFGADFVHVDDVVAALSIALENPVDGPLNVGSGMRTTISELAALLAQLTGRTDAPIATDPLTPNADIGFPALAIGRMRALGYAPRSLRAGLTDMLGARAVTG